jgi:4-hydroxyphenylpyruvate dioxygenase
MEELGCDSLLVCSNVSPDSLGGIDRSAADFHELGEHAAKRGLRVGFEALAWGRHINDYRDAWEVVRRANHPAIGLVLDSFHTYARKTDLKPLHAIPGDRIFLVQLADAPWLDMDVLNWSRHFRCFPGQGDLPLLDFMAAIQATGYQGELSLEIFNDQFRAGSPRPVAIDGQRSLVYLMDQMREKNGKAASDLPKMPPRSKCLGVEFIEFAVDDRTADEFARLLTGLGFRNTAHHRSKAVSRWTQGAINLVINKEKEGFAHSHYITHGPSVCAIGLKVDSAAATLDRAEKLRDTPFRQKVGPGELEIPAVRGLRASESRQQRRGRPHSRRSHLAVDALRGHAVMAVVLHIAARRAEDAAGRYHRPRRDCTQSGRGDSGWHAADRPQRFAKYTDAVIALSQ